MKKMLLLAVLLLVLAFSVTPFTAQGETLVMWTQYDLTSTEDGNAVTLSAKIAEFEAATGITVVHEQVAWDQLALKLSIAVQSGGDVPDIVEAGSQHIPSLLDAGALMALDELLVDSAFVADLGEGDSNACIIDGVRYCVATNVRGGMTYFDLSVLESFPETVEEWLAVGDALKADGLFLGTQYAGRSYGSIEIMWWPMIASNGGNIFDEEGKPAWATPEVAEVVEFGRTLFNQGYFPAVNVTGDFADAEAPWMAGEAAAFRGGSWSAIFVPGLKAAVDAGEVGMTGGVDFGNGPFVFMVSESWVVAQGAANPEGAKLWFESVFEPEYAAAWATAQFGIPTLTSAYEVVDFDSIFYASVDEILGSQGLYMQQSPFYVESLDTLVVAFQEMFLDPSINVLERLEEAQNEVLNLYW